VELRKAEMAQKEEEKKKREEEEFWNSQRKEKENAEYVHSYFLFPNFCCYSTN